MLRFLGPFKRDNEIAIERAFNLVATLCIFIVVSLISSCSSDSSKLETYVYPNDSYFQSSAYENRISWEKFKSLTNKGLLSGRVYFKPGKYMVSNAIPIKGNNPLYLYAEDGAQFVGNFDFRSAKAYSSGFKLYRGDITFSGFNFENVGYCVYVNQSSMVSNVHISKLKASNVHSCIVIDRDVQGPVKNWRIDDAIIKGYYRVAIRISGNLSSNFKINNVIADGSHPYSANHCFKGGIQIYRGAHNISINSANIKNNIGNCNGTYQQGDGVEVDDKGGVPHDITFSNVFVENSRDGNFDLKGKNIKFDNVVSVAGLLSRYAFKLWSYDSYHCYRCKVGGGFDYYLTLMSSTLHLQKFIISEGEKSTAFLKCQETIKGVPPQLKLTQNSSLPPSLLRMTKGCSVRTLINQ